MLSTCRTSKHSRGFTLVELAIVLVIIGLLVGGIMAGKGLIRSAGLRSITTDYNKFVSAQQNFKTQYGFIPGDMPNATKYFGVRTGATGTSSAGCYNILNVTTGTCDGNGDGFLTDNGASATCPELFLYWQHLAGAGLIVGSFTGAATDTTHCYHWTTNSPISRLGSMNIWFTDFDGGPQSGSPDYFDGDYNNESIRVAYAEGDNLLTAQEAKSIDIKTDDGSPATGDLFVFKNTSSIMPGCATTNVVSTAAYSTSSSDAICTLHMKMPQ